MRCTTILAEFECGGHSHLGAPPPPNVALGYDVGKISAGCLVIIAIQLSKRYVFGKCNTGITLGYGGEQEVETCWRGRCWWRRIHRCRSWVRELWSLSLVPSPAMHTIPRLYTTPTRFVVVNRFLTLCANLAPSQLLDVLLLLFLCPRDKARGLKTRSYKQNIHGG